jgi:hypothetical protein
MEKTKQKPVLIPAELADTLRGICLLRGLKPANVVGELVREWAAEQKKVMGIN